jgi:OmpA-OmpF porin, OOP family
VAQKHYSTRGLRWWAAAVLVGLATMPAGAQETCADLRAAFVAVVPGSTLPGVIAAGRKIIDGNACDAATRRGIGRAIALVHVRESESLSDPAARLALLEGGLPFARHWRLMAAIGAMREKVPAANGRPDRSGASLAYQEAIEDIQNQVDVPNPPPAEDIQRIARLAQQNRMLSGEFVPGDVLSRCRCGGPAGLAVVPVQYAYNSDEMTSLGRRYADEALRVLTEHGRPKVTLVGHTDPHGSDRLNVELSRRRAAAFKRFLVAKGYPAANIETDGAGKSQPLHVDNEGNYTRDELFQIFRRVEVNLK